MKKPECVGISLVIALILALSVTSFSQDKKTDKVSSEKEKDIVKLLTEMGTAEIGVEAMEHMISAFSQSMPDVPDEFWKEFMTEVGPEDMIRLVVPIYGRHLSHDDVKELIRFFESPTGRRYVQALPEITRESMVAGQEWGQLLGERALLRLEEKGFNPFVQARKTERKHKCAANLMMIDAAKEELALDKGLPGGAVVKPEDLADYLPVSFESLKCPEDGEYTIGPIGHNPKCSKDGHGLAAR